MGRQKHSVTLKVTEAQLKLLSTRARQIAECFLKVDMMTDRQVMEHLGFSDMNQVRPRITELVDSGILKEIGETYDHKTRKRCRLVALTSKNVQMPSLFD